MSAHWGDVPTWVAAVGTVGTLAAALWQIRNERNRRLIADDQLRHERRLEQARLVAAYLGEKEIPDVAPDQRTLETGRTAIYIANNSSEPVYSVVVGLMFIQGAGPRSLEAMIQMNREQYSRQGPVTTVNDLPGGLYRVWIRRSSWDGILSGRSGVEIAFTDRAGAHWVRRAAGSLEELAESPLEHFRSAGLDAPYEFQIPERVPIAA